MARYPFQEIEKKWQRHWDEHQTFKTLGPGDDGFDPAKPKYYVLDMFPYPSGDGLHVGHPEGYTATDIVARYKRMRGFNVLHPMGWDSFGLPAEQYAVKKGLHPAEAIRRNIANFKRQIKSLGLSYDWSREIATSDASYYRWTQWIFLKLWHAGLAYQAEVPVWWCDQLGTVLANEEVDSEGRSEIGGYPCVRRPMRQWMLRITDYAQRLIDDLPLLDWPAGIKRMQEDWIGRSEGADVHFRIAGGETGGETLTIYTTRPDTLFGATYMVLAPEHHLVSKVTTDAQRAEVQAYIDRASRRSELERTALSREKTGVFTGGYAVNPVNDERIPIWIADYVLISYGTGAIMAVPAHDDRDFEFALAFGLPIREVVTPPPGVGADGILQAEREGTTVSCYTGEGTAANSPVIDGLPTPEAIKRITAWLEEKRLGRMVVRYKLRDWLFSRQRYWGEPFPIVFWSDGTVEALRSEDLPLTLPQSADFKPTGDFEPPLARCRDWVTVTGKGKDGRPGLRETNVMPQWAGSCWYYLRFMDPLNGREPWSKEKEQYWGPVDLYVGGAEHAVLHLLYARFWHKVLYDLKLVSTPEPFHKLFNQGMILGTAYQTARGSIVRQDTVTWDGDTPRHPETGEPLQVVTAKMSKSLGNVVNPDEVIEAYGADSFRLYEMFMGPLEATKQWNTRDIAGVHRFLQRVWRVLAGGVAAEGNGGGRESYDAGNGSAAGTDGSGESSEDGGEGESPVELLLDGPGMEVAPEVEKLLHRMIKQVTGDLENLRFNTAISKMMIFVNELYKGQGRRFSRDQGERFVKVLSPFAPHLAEELWNRLGRASTVAYEPWPSYDPALCVEDTVEIVVQINGKIKGIIDIPRDASQEQVQGLVEQEQSLAEKLSGCEIRKVIYVRNRLVNYVV